MYIYICIYIYIYIYIYTYIHIYIYIYIYFLLTKQQACQTWHGHGGDADVGSESLAHSFR